jgi:competence protein ComFA
MQVNVYAVKLGKNLDFHVSLAMQAVLSWWTCNKSVEIYVEPNRQKCSLGQALRKCEHLRQQYVRLGTECISNWERYDGENCDVQFNLMQYESFIANFAGRYLLTEEIKSLVAKQYTSLQGQWHYAVQWGVLDGKLTITNGMINKPRIKQLKFWQREQIQCVRCGNETMQQASSWCPNCGESCAYCEACITMGKVRFCSLIVHGHAHLIDTKRSLIWSKIREVASTELSLVRWNLSEAQTEAVRDAIKFVQGERARSREFLLWAVTGAGKTEMIYPLVQTVAASGGRVCIASPRKDVILELLPRLKIAFPEIKIQALYGGCEERWEQAELILATTHQLIRYRTCFDLVILDEIDAFPYYGDQQLAYIVNQAARKEGKFVLLSATPPQTLRKLANKGKLPHALVCVRYHGYPLPVPEKLRIKSIQRWSKQGQVMIVPPKLTAAINRSLHRGAQIFIFVPLIAQVKQVVESMQHSYQGIQIAGISSRDPVRTDKVLQFRQLQLRIIVTTTILERGVTVPKSDVFVLEADSPLFQSTTLIQMAGRAGRRADDPYGYVTFCSTEWTRSQREAVRDIRRMNKIALQQGYLRVGSGGSR